MIAKQTTLVNVRTFENVDLKVITNVLLAP